ncbi:MAG: hypothetical protein HEQ23_07485 [Tepidisphaera sp.]
MKAQIVSISALLVCAGSAMGQLAIPSVVIPGGDDPRTGQPWQGPGAYPRTVTSANLNVSIAAGTTLNGNSDTGDQALKVFPIRSGPFPYLWTSGWTNEGDIDASISPVEPNNPLSFPPDQFVRLRDGRDPVSGANDGGGLRTYAWSINQYHGVVTMSVRANGRDNQDVVFGVPVGRLYGLANVSADTFRTGRSYSMIDGTHRSGAGSLYLSMHYAGTPGNQEMSLDCAAAWFPFVEGWIGAYVRGGPGTSFVEGDGQVAATPGLPTSVVTWDNNGGQRGEAFVSFPGVNSATDGVLLASPYQDGNNPDYVVASPREAGWDITYRRTSLDSASELQGPGNYRFNFVYVPYSASNAIAGRIDGSTGSSLSGTSNYTITRLETGRYRLSIAGKSDQTGSLMLQSSGIEPGTEGIGRRAFFSYQGNPDGSFEIQARALVLGNPGNAFGEDTELVDGDFSFVWLDHSNPISLCPIDFNRDGFVDFFDYDGYVSCFESGICESFRTADFNFDGFVDFFDYDAFVAGFEAGC